MKDFVTAFLFILCALEFVYANEYYISTSGVDGDGCGIQYTPCATLNFTLTLANDGDTIYFLDGEYKNQPNVTINLDNLSFVGQGNVTFNGIGNYENFTLFHIVGKNLSFENLRFSYFFVNSVIHTLPLFFIQLPDEGTYTFTNISYSYGEDVVIATYATNTSVPHLGQITLNNVTIFNSKLTSAVISNLQLQLNQLIIDNCTAATNFVSIYLYPQTAQAVTSITNCAVLNHSSGTFLNYYGPYSTQGNDGGDDIVTISNFTFADSTGNLGFLFASNLIVTSISVTNVVISGNYQSLIVHSDVVSLEVSNSVFDQCSHPSTTGGHIIYIVRGANTTDLRASVTVNALTVSNSINVDLNAGILDEHPIDFTYSNLDFYNVTSTAIVDFVSPSTTVENIYFSSCTGGYLRAATFPENITVTNITIADSICNTYCVYFINYDSADILLNNLTFTNVQSTNEVNHIVCLSATDSAFTANNFAVVNATGFLDCFFYSNANLTLNGNFEYSNVTTNGTVTPLFNCGYDNSSNLIVDTLLNLPLSALFPPFSECNANYLGFPLPTKSTYLGPYNTPSNLPIAWIVACACFSLVAIVLAACFILYRRTTSSYTPING